MIPVFLALGSNLGDRLAHLREGIIRLSREISVIALSSVYESPPAEGADPPDFLNAVLRGEAELSPTALLDLAHEVEAASGRRRRADEAGNGSGGEPRTLDVDLVYHGTSMVRREGLVVPHPRRLERAFVLRPLAEVAPDWVDPVTGRTVRCEWRARRQRLGAVTRVAGPGRLRASGEEPIGEARIMAPGER